MSGQRRSRKQGDPLDRSLLVAIRAVHSAIFLVELCSIGWLVLTGLVNRRDRTVAVAAGLVTVESAVFILNGRVCPLTPLAERHGAVRGSVSDIFLPDIVARTIPVWSSALLAGALALHLRGAICADVNSIGGAARDATAGRRFCYARPLLPRRPQRGRTARWPRTDGRMSPR